jgi:hypothetical protein
MSRLGIAFSAGAEPAEIVESVPRPMPSATSRPGLPKVMAIYLTAIFREMTAF